MHAGLPSEHAEGLERGREAYASRRWRAAYESLVDADRAVPLAPEDLELLATAAYMLGRQDDWVGAMERAHDARLDAGETLRAIRCAFWLGMTLMLQGEGNRATGWFGRARRVLDREPDDCVERGYLLIPLVIRLKRAGDYVSAYAAAREAADIGERFDERELLTMAVYDQGGALVKQGRVEEGFALIDEAMLAITAEKLSPIVTGLIYCSAIAFCQSVYEVPRAREWTDALTQWCEAQPDMLTHTGLCLVHRAEIMELGGAWADALLEARRAGERFAHAGRNPRAEADAVYIQGDVHRLRGAFDAAEEAYREASRLGRHPQPGLAQLRLAQGNAAAAVVAIRRAVSETSDPLARARLLPAYVEIMLTAGELDEAHSACRELEGLAATQRTLLLDARSAHARGAVKLACGDAAASLAMLRGACRVSRELAAPYEAACARALIALACRALGDEEAAAMEMHAAREVFVSLGAQPDVERADSLAMGTGAVEAHGLSPRELEILRLVAAGARNKAIPAELVLSERTVERHVSGIFSKLRVSSRTAAAAYAYEHKLV